MTRSRVWDHTPNAQFVQGVTRVREGCVPYLFTLILVHSTDLRDP